MLGDHFIGHRNEKCSEGSSESRAQTTQSFDTDESRNAKPVEERIPLTFIYYSQFKFFADRRYAITISTDTILGDYKSVFLNTHLTCLPEIPCRNI